MKKLVIATAALSLSMAVLSPSAFAGSSYSYGSDAGYSSSSSSYSYGSNAGHSSSYSAGGTSNCPVGTTPSHDGTCLMNSGSSFGYSSSSATAPLGSYSGHTSYSSHATTAPIRSYSGHTSYSSGSTIAPISSYSGHSTYANYGTVGTMSDSEADYKYGSGSISATYTDGSNTIVPFSTTAATLTNYRVPGMGANEFLSPTKCPVSVYNPEGGQVMGCYAVSKPVQKKVYQTVKVVRPIIYVRYAQPCCKPVYRPPVCCKPVVVKPCCKPVVRRPVCCEPVHTRYGADWPRQWRRW